MKERKKKELVMRYMVCECSLC